MLLLSKMSFEENRIIWKTRENRISLTRWKKKKKNRLLSLSKSLFVWLQQFQPFSQSNREGVSSSLTNAKNRTFLSFFLEFHQLLRTSRFQISFHISRFQQSPNQKERRKQNKFKTCFANAVEISIISTNLIKITLSQITIQKEKEWRLVSFCENCYQSSNTAKMKNKTNEVEISFHSLFVFIIAEKKERKKEKIVKFIFILQQTTSIHSHSFNIIKPVTINHNQTTMRMRRGKGENEHHQQPSNKSKPHRLTRAWREGKQTTLPQLPAFPAFCKCNEHPITSNAHWYPSGHSCRPRSVPLMF